ncbi:MAG: histidine ammonia-lyase [Halobacteriovoraceae bacterium]|nr:histidine ammonia-lyase [Halobacteriovoraceae bacterium]
MEIIVNRQIPSLEEIFKIAHAKDNELSITLTKGLRRNMMDCRAYVMEIVDKGDPVYGINTGLGALSNKKIDRNNLAQLQLNLIRSHCAGVGESFPREMVRVIMFLRVLCLSHGYSGIEPSIVDLLIKFLEKGITPLVPKQGSVGASGDLAPLSHIALCLIGEGEVEYCGKKMLALNAIKKIKEAPAVLGPKDGLALINGTAVMGAQLSMNLFVARKLARLADIANFLTLDAIKGTTQAYHLEAARLKPHPGQLVVCSNFAMLMSDSGILESHRDCEKIQDPYSLRCAPQVHGAARQTITHAQDVLEVEMGSITDNPLLFFKTREVVSGGNFHGEALALAMDYLAMGLAEFANISERRIEKMMNPVFSELPAFLAKKPGLESGMMIAQVTAAALTSENKIHCHPASVDSIPTSTDKEDHVSMGVTSGHKLEKVVENLSNVLSIELLCASHALEFHRPLKTSPALEEVVGVIRKKIPPMNEDRVLSRDIQIVKNSLDFILQAVEEKIGKLG